MPRVTFALSNIMQALHFQVSMKTSPMLVVYNAVGCFVLIVRAIGRKEDIMPAHTI